MQADDNRLKSYNEKKEGARRVPRAGKIILVIVLIAAVLLALTTFITDILWFREVGYLSVFLKKPLTYLELGLPIFAVITALAYVYLRTMKKSYLDKKSDKWANRLIPVLTGLAIALFCVPRMWMPLLKFANQEDFGLKDPIFGNDVSFYVFNVDFFKSIIMAVLLLAAVMLVISLLYYMILNNGNAIEYDPDKEDEEIRGDKFTQNEHELNEDENPFVKSFKDVRRAEYQRQGVSGGDPNMRRFFDVAGTRVMIMGVIIFLCIAAYYFFKQYSILERHTGVVYGAGWVDVHIRLWVYRVILVLAVAGAISVIYALRKYKLKVIIYAPTAMIAVGMLGIALCMVFQSLVVSPDELDKESKYLKYNIKYTREAYGLADVKNTTFSMKQDLTAEDIQDNQATIANIRINDYDPTLTFYNQTQAIRQYYDFEDIYVDRYKINGQYTQTYLSAREINEESINDTWINRHLRYTHGYGVTMSQVDRITESGQPEMLVKNIPPESDVEEIKITRPEIYFGEMTNDYVVVGADEKEFDYPDGDNNKYTKYEGSGGIKLNPFNRLMFSLRNRNLKLLVSSSVNSDSRILMYRNVQERIQKIMPYLDYEAGGAYMVTSGGRLYWIMDAYTSTDKFPYSQTFAQSVTSGNVDYIRNSVKVVVDAYNGSVDFYIVDEDDPLAATYRNIYPKLFKDVDDMPEDLRAHIRYPSTMFSIQASAYQTYHVNDVNVFYQGEDNWNIANETYGTKTQAMTPNYYILNLQVDDNEEEFVNSIPYTPGGKKNLSGILMARNDGDHYGELVLYTMPKSKLTYGPEQVEARIDQNTEIAKEFSLWQSNGSKYSRGNMFVIPIDDSLLYIEPIYLEAQNSSIPEVKRVVVSYGDRIAYEATLAEALDEMFGSGAGEGYSGEGSSGGDASGSAAKPQTETKAEIIEKAQKAFDAMTEARQAGDWDAYEKEDKKLRDYLNRLQ